MRICTWDRPLTSTRERICGRMSFGIYLGICNLKLCYFSLSIYSTSLPPCRKFRPSFLGEAAAAARAALPIATSACSIFVCQTVAWLPVFGIFNMCADADDATAGGGCTKTTRESAVKADPGHEICCCIGERKPVSVGSRFHQLCVSGVKVPPTVCQWGQGSTN